MKKGFVVSAVLYPLLVIALALIMGVISMSDNRRKILDNMKLEVSEESESDPEMTNSSLYYKIKALEEAYGELNARFSEEYFDQIKADYEAKIKNAKTELTNSINSAKSSAISTAKSQVKLEVFPVGSIFTSTTSTNPSSYIGGTWQAYGQGRTLVGIDTSQTEFNTVNKTGGNKTFNNSHSHTVASHTHTINSHTHTTGNHTLTVNEIPNHTHYINEAVMVYSDKGNSPITYGGQLLMAGAGWMDATYGAGYRFTTATGGGASHSHGNTGGSGTLTTNGNTAQTTGLGGSSTQSLLQPYITVYFWKRTA